MSWAQVEQACLFGAAGLLAGCAAIGFRVVASPYLPGYLSAAGGLVVLSRVAAARRRGAPGAAST
jgi:hypothetical protein